MLHRNNLFTSEPYCARYEGTTMSQQLTISSLFSVLALAALCMVAVANEQLGADYAAPQALVQAERAPGLPS